MIDQSDTAYYGHNNCPWDCDEPDTKAVIITTKFYIPLPRGISNLSEEKRSIYAGEMLNTALGLDYEGIYDCFGECWDETVEGNFDVLIFKRASYVYGAAMIEHDEDGDAYESSFEVDDDDWELRDIPDEVCKRMREELPKKAIEWNMDYDWE